MMGVPAFLALIPTIASRKKIIFIELAPPLMLVSSTMLTMLVNFAGIIGEVNEVLRTQQQFASLIVYGLSGAFCASTWMPHAISRALFIFVQIGHVSALRSYH